MVKNDFNIELAHIYINEDVTREHYQAIDIAQYRSKQLEAEGKKGVITAMIDDYNPSEWILQLDDYFAIFDTSNLPIDFIVYESNLALLKDAMLDELPPRIRKNEEKYIEKSGKCPCSFLIAIWYLLRLGHFEATPEVIPPHSTGAPFSAERIITILPQRYQGVEKKALDLLMSTRFAPELEGHIEHIFF